jgi:hypothetical protein
MFAFIGVLLIVLSACGASLSTEDTPLDRFLWVPAFWFGAVLLIGVILADLIWGYWP